MKPTDQLTDAKVADALAWPGRLFADRGWRVEVWSGCDPVVLDNVRFLAGYRRPSVIDEGVVACAWQQVIDGEPLGLAERRLTCAGGFAWYVVRPALLALLWRGRLTTDLSRPLSAGSVLHRAGER